MSLGPGHCACCCAGTALPVVPLLELCGAVWVIEHLAAVLIVCAVSGLLSTALAVVVFRQARIRDDRRMTLWRQVRHAEVEQSVRPRAVIRAEATSLVPIGTKHLPEVAPAPAKAALGAPPKSWLCQTCYWAWPLDVPFCGICGHNRANSGDEREVVIRQAIGNSPSPVMPRGIV